MLVFRWIFLLAALCSMGCNSPTISPVDSLPRFSSENYEHLDCLQLKKEVDRLDFVIKQLSAVKNEPHYVMHKDMPFVGTGDSMGAVELIRSKAERTAVQRVFDEKDCAHAAY